MTRDEVIDVLTAVAAADRRTVGEADIDVWQAVIGDLAVNYALRALRDHLREEPGVWVQPGHIFQRGRALRRAELEREPDELREARQAGLDARFADQLAEIAESKRIPPPPRPPNPMRVRCPWCKAAVLAPCIAPGSGRRPMRGYHPARHEALSSLIESRQAEGARP